MLEEIMSKNFQSKVRNIDPQYTKQTKEFTSFNTAVKLKITEDRALLEGAVEKTMYIHEGIKS